MKQTKMIFKEGDVVKVYGIGNGAHTPDPQIIVRMPKEGDQTWILRHYKTKNLSYIIGSVAIVEAEIPVELPEVKENIHWWDRFRWN